MLLVHFCITIRIISTTLAFVRFPADNLDSGQSNCRFSNSYHGNNDEICINLHLRVHLLIWLTLFYLYLEKNNYLLQWQRTNNKVWNRRESVFWLRELRWLVLPSKRSWTTSLAIVMILDLLNHCLHSIKRLERLVTPTTKAKVRTREIWVQMKTNNSLMRRLKGLLTSGWSAFPLFSEKHSLSCWCTASGFVRKWMWKMQREKLVQ